MGVTETITIVLIILKLAHVIDWSWWIVLLPEIIALVGYIVVPLFVFGTALGFVGVIKKIDKL